jgi:Family of unknown function (DUF6527)
MKRIKKWSQQFARVVRDRLHRRLVPSYGTRLVEDYLPKKLKKRMLYIVQDGGFLEQAAMLCPCGCNRILHMNLLPDEHPCWRLTRHKDGTASLYPSVWRKVDCQSHFWFRHGRVHWFKGRDENHDRSPSHTNTRLCM